MELRFSLLMSESVSSLPMFPPWSACLSLSLEKIIADGYLVLSLHCVFQC